MGSYWGGFQFLDPLGGLGTDLWLAGNEGMDKNMETTVMRLYRVWGLGFRVGMKEWKRTWTLL